MRENQKYKFLEHTADIKFRVYGKGMNELFENVILALSEYISKGEKIQIKKKNKFNISGEDNEQLLYKFIDEIIYLLDAKKIICVKGKVKINGKKLECEIEGDDAKKYNLDPIKAATYSEMYIKQNKNKLWEAQAVVDI
jgi:SHS2 domain-containing protein